MRIEWDTVKIMLKSLPALLRRPAGNVAPLFSDMIAAIFLVTGESGVMVYLVKHSATSDDFPGYMTFPAMPCAAGNATATLHQLAQETLGFNLEDALKTGIARNIQPLEIHESFELLPERSKTHYYVVHLAQIPDISPQPPAVATGQWQTPAEFSRLFEQGHILTLPATEHLLDIIEHDPTGDTPLKFQPLYEEYEVPYWQPLAGIYQFLLYSHKLAANHRTNCFLLGDQGEKKYLVDPATKDDHEFEKLRHTLDKHEFTDIFITHHHSDHHHLTPHLARTYSVPMTMSAYTHDQLRRRHGKHYLDHITIKQTGEGDILTKWLGKNIKVYEVPGHDWGQLALAPDSMEWFLAGDLIQGEGTVMIGNREGDMQKYFASLSRILELAPAIVLPSHGLIRGSCYQVRKTLEHRRQREKQIQELYDQGLSPAQIVESIYQKVDRRLWPMALQSVYSHLKKIKAEKSPDHTPNSKHTI